MENETRNVEIFFGGKENAKYHELNVKYLAIELIGKKFGNYIPFDPTAYSSSQQVVPHNGNLSD